MLQELTIILLIISFIIACVIEFVFLDPKTPRYSDGTYKPLKKGGKEHILRFLLIFILVSIFLNLAIPIIIIQFLYDICFMIIILSIIAVIMVILIYVKYKKKVKRIWGE